MQFEQIKAITEKYGPVLEQLDRLASPQFVLGSVEYFNTIGELKLAVADQFMSEVKKQMDQQISQELPTQEMNNEV